MNTERRWIAARADDVPPEFAVVGPGVRCVEDAAVGGVVEKLHRRAVRFEIFAPDLISEVYAQKVDPRIDSSVRERGVRRRVEIFRNRDVVVDVLGEIDLRATCPAGNLHGS